MERGDDIVIRPVGARRVISGHIKIVSRIGAQPVDRDAGGAASEIADLLPSAVDPFIDQVAVGSRDGVPREIDLRARHGGRHDGGGGRNRGHQIASLETLDAQSESAARRFPCGGRGRAWDEVRGMRRRKVNIGVFLETEG